MLPGFLTHRIAARLLAPLLVLGLLAGVTCGAGILALKRSALTLGATVQSDATAATEAAQLNAMLIDLGRATWRALALDDAATTSRSAEELAALGPAIAGLTASLAARLATDPAGRAVLAEVEPRFGELRAAATRGLAMLAEGRGAEGRRYLQDNFSAQLASARSQLARLVTLTATRANEHAAAAVADAERIGWLVALSLAGVLLVGLGGVLLLALRDIAAPIGRIAARMRGMTEGDLATAVPETARRDELGGMARALEGFATALRETEALRARQGEAERRAEQERKAAMLRLADSLEQQVGGVVEGVASAATELTSAANSMVQIAEQTGQRAGTVGQASAVAHGEVNTVAAATEELAASVAEIGRQIAESARMATGAVAQAERTDMTVANLTEAATKVSEVTRLIGDIAAQTNLLALNATIEAARAGEAGKGFAVVASEVKALANQTAKATESISGQIAAMQAATGQAAGDLGAIRQSIGQISEVTAAVAAAVEQQGAATREIAASVQRAAVGTQDIAGAIEGVAAAASETGGAASQVQATSTDLSRQAEQLKREVGAFLQQVRAA